ncbi:MAG: hypothetical protein HZA61_07010 [Candidatus Eisenbacteria bacterium]|uniref:T9SS type A sorting domain-containing protein n=1 Tax=Eiseniibacteriota bacterium TaxID=2212470 RepID=A0A933SD70_UNCEI|nr:hypothetical protein [Candidatus Eisenbacteria bacterium]
MPHSHVLAAVLLAALSFPLSASAGPAGVRRPLAPPITGHALWDADRHQCWVFEASSEGVWSYDPAAITHWKWHGIGSFGAGLGQYGSGRNVFLDRARSRLVVPGFTQLGVLAIRTNMTWEFPSTQGAPLDLGAAVYDEAGDRLIALGEDGVLSQLTLSDPPTWSALAVVNPSLGIAGDQAMVLDPEHGVLVITGGTRWEGACQAYVPSYASWKLPLATLTWSALPALSVPGAYDMQFLWDGARHRVLAVGGRYGFFCEADGQWYEGASSQVYGLDPVAASPAWNLVTFRPDFRTSGAVVLDPDADRLLSFGGFSPSRGIIAAETWNEVLAMPFGGPTALAWAVQATGSPNSAQGSDFAFDPRRGHVLLHGGLRALSAYGDYATSGAIAAFDDPDTLWGAFATAHDAMDAAVAVDALHDRVVYFGGRSQSASPGSPPVWLNTTTVVSLASGAVTSPVTGTKPPARTHGSLVWDAQRQKFLLLGGENASGMPLHDAWLLDPATWTWSALATTGTPPSGDVRCAVYDPAAHVTLVHDSNGDVAVLAPGAGTDTWTVLGRVGDVPMLQSIALDTARHRLLGLDASLGVFEAALGGPSLAWNALHAPQATSVEAVAMYDAIDDRMLIGLRAMPQSPGKAGLWAVDFGAGALGVAGRGPGRGDALRLAGAQPSARGPEVECTLSTGVPARLEVFDVTGRRVWSRDVTALGAGVHRVRAGEGLALAPGVYAVRLVRGPEASTVRAVVIR